MTPTDKTSPASERVGVAGVTRQTPESYSGRFVGMTPHPLGQWVAYADHLAQLEAVERERDEALKSAETRLRCWEEACKLADAARGELYATVRKFNCDDAEKFWRNIGKLTTRAETAEASLAAMTAERDAMEARKP